MLPPCPAPPAPGCPLSAAMTPESALAPPAPPPPAPAAPALPAAPPVPVVGGGVMTPPSTGLATAVQSDGPGGVNGVLLPSRQTGPVVAGYAAASSVIVTTAFALVIDTTLTVMPPA